MSFESSFIASKSFEGKSAVLRVDYNVPIENGGKLLNKVNHNQTIVRPLF